MGRRARNPTIRIKLDLSDLRKTLRTMEGDVDRTLKRTKRRSEETAAQITKDFKRAAQSAGKDLKDGLGGADKIAQTLGGSLTEVTGDLENLIVGAQELHEVLGPNAAAAGAVAIGVGAVAAAAISAGTAYRDLINDSHELLQEWEDLAGFTPISDEAITAINSAKDELDGTAQAAERAQLVMAGDLAQAFEGMGDLATGVLAKIDSFGAGLVRVRETTESWGRTMALVVSAGSAVRFFDALDSVTEQGEQLNDTLTEQRDLLTQTETATDAQTLATGILERIEAEQAKAREERNKRWIARIEKTQAAVQSLDAVTRRRAGSTVSEEVKIQQEYEETNRLIEEQIDRLLAVGDVGQDTAAALAATQRAQQANEEARARALEQLEQKRTATLRKEQEKRAQDFIRAEEQRAEALAGIEERIARTRQENNAAALDLTMTLANTTTDALQLVSEREQEADLRDLDNKRRKIQELKDLRAEAQERRKQARKDNDAAELASAEADLAQIKRRMGARREEARAIRKSLRRQARAQKALALTSVATNTAAGIVRTIALMGAPVPPNIPAIAGVAAVAASGAVQAARIASERLPTFAHGGAVTPGGPDHRAVSVSPREAILNERATQRLGSQGINALNHDQALAPQVTVVQTLDRRVIASAMADTIPAAVARELDAQQGLMPGQRTVYRRD